ncbi:MAG: hypothetical protein GY832_36985 [Chloroflexi bacterium]|nr:hypothetical protein [Chloroflexota bacterium]
MNLGQEAMERGGGSWRCETGVLCLWCGERAWRGWEEEKRCPQIATGTIGLIYSSPLLPTRPQSAPSPSSPGLAQVVHWLVSLGRGGGLRRGGVGVGGWG